jgi:hypothetical protein
MMNDRIREVWIKAANEDSDPDNWDSQEQFIERFGKMIAKETILEVWIQLFNHGIDLSENTLFLEAMKKTKEHFGVEE